jgi:hypothetical protein
MELNPNHPVTRQAHDQWHKIAILLLNKFCPKGIVINLADIQKLTDDWGEMPSIVMHDRADGLHLYIVDETKGRELAATEGGLPV